MKLAAPSVLTALFLALMPTPVRAQVGQGLLDPNVANKEELLKLSDVTDTLVEALVAARPFADPAAFDAFLEKQELDEAAREKLYAHLFLHVNLNTASSETFQLIPGVGGRMAHEFEEYRPWKSWKQFDKEIGKYVKEPEVARLKQYVFIPLDLNTASEEDFMTIPGVGKRMAHEFEEYRPWKAKAQFEEEIGKYVDEAEVARLWRYMSIAKD